jgi:hypothetical protein
MQLYHLVDIGKTKPEALDIMGVACMHSIELVEYSLQVFLLNTYSVI